MRHMWYVLQAEQRATSKADMAEACAKAVKDALAAQAVKTDMAMRKLLENKNLHSLKLAPISTPKMPPPAERCSSIKLQLLSKLFREKVAARTRSGGDPSLKTGAHSDVFSNHEERRPLKTSWRGD
jgi:hypothetical protein